VANFSVRVRDRYVPELHVTHERRDGGPGGVLRTVRYHSRGPALLRYEEPASGDHTGRK